MQNSSLYKARELSPSVRQALETLLGRTLNGDEQISIRAYAPHEAPQGRARETAVRGLEEHFSTVDERLKEVPQEEVEQAVDEALRHVRPSCRPVR